MNAPMYILTAADGFTTCCYAAPETLVRELRRVSLRAPIILHHWARVNGHGPHNGWKLCDTRMIDGVV